MEKGLSSTETIEILDSFDWDSDKNDPVLYAEHSVQPAATYDSCINSPYVNTDYMHHPQNYNNAWLSSQNPEIAQSTNTFNHLLFGSYQHTSGPQWSSTYSGYEYDGSTTVYSAVLPFNTARAQCESVPPMSNHALASSNSSYSTPQPNTLHDNAMSDTAISSSEVRFQHKSVQAGSPQPEHTTCNTATQTELSADHMTRHETYSRHISRVQHFQCDACCRTAPAL